MHEALSNNLDLRIATARVDEFAAILAGTKSQASPQIGYGLSGNRSRASEQKIPDFVDPLSTTFSTVLSASWEIDLWGRIRRETEAARANLLATEEARRGVTLTLISSVIASYVTLLDLDAQLRVAQGTAAGTQEIRRAVRNEARCRLGLGIRDVAGPAEYEVALPQILRSSRRSRRRNMRCRCSSDAIPVRSPSRRAGPALHAGRSRRASFRAPVAPARHPARPNSS